MLYKLKQPLKNSWFDFLEIEGRGEHLENLLQLATEEQHLSQNKILAYRSQGPQSTELTDFFTLEIKKYS